MNLNLTLREEIGGQEERKDQCTKVETDCVELRRFLFFILKTLSACVLAQLNHNGHGITMTIADEI